MHTQNLLHNPFWRILDFVRMPQIGFIKSGGNMPFILKAKGMIKRMFILMISLLLLALPTNSYNQTLKKAQYVETPKKDFNADAPWRVQDADTPIPFQFLIRDVFKDNMLHVEFILNSIKIYLHSFIDPSKTVLIYDHDFGGIKIDEKDLVNGYWECIIDTFANSNDGNPNGTKITPRRIREASNIFENDIFFKAQLFGKEIDDIKFTKFLKVHDGEPLPKPNNNWYYGDTHYHSEYTDNIMEYGGTLKLTLHVLKSMGLDWVTLTDHASNHKGVFNGWFAPYWDLSDKTPKEKERGSSWDNRNARMDSLNDSNGLPFMGGEETYCQPEAGKVKNQMHLLIYNNKKLIVGEIEGLIPEAKNSIEEVLGKLESEDPSAFAYAAHPMEDDANITPWSNANYIMALSNSNFMGLQVWNTRKTRETGATSISVDDLVNPFNDNGEWEERLPDWDHDLLGGITTWDVLLRKYIKGPRKIFIEGGSDAHGDINYKITGVRSFFTLDDNALGKVRTLVYAPGGKTRTNILNGLINGHSVVTDGPVVIFGIDQNQNGILDENDAMIGDNIELQFGENVTFLVEWYSTLEFGEISEITLLGGNIFALEPIPMIIFNPTNGFIGSKIWSQMQTVIPGTYYYRVEARSTKNNETYRCYTNPIWVTWKDNYLADSAWPMLGANRQHTGVCNYVGPENPYVKWRCLLGNSQPTGNPVSGPDGTIYIGTWYSNFYAVDSSGTIKWTFLDEKGVYTEPAVDADSIIYVGLSQYAGSSLYAIHKSGGLKWKFKTRSNEISSPAIGYDGTVFFTADSTLYAMDPVDTLKWTYKTRKKIASRSPAIYLDGTIYVTSDSLYAIYPDGTLKWSTPGGGDIVIDDDGTIYLWKGGLYSVSLQAFDTDGAKKWTYSIRENDLMRTIPVIGKDGTIYVQTTPGFPDDPAS